MAAPIHHYKPISGSHKTTVYPMPICLQRYRFMPLNANFSRPSASSLVLPPRSEVPSNRAYTNGHLSPPNGRFDNTAMSPSSESDLSEAIDPQKPTSPSSQGLQEDSEHDYNSRRNSISSEDADAIGSDDADYEMESPPPPEIHVTRDGRSSSHDSRRTLKRKAGGIEEDEFIMNNPELYGIRRSVSIRSRLPLLRS